LWGSQHIGKELKGRYLYWRELKLVLNSVGIERIEKFIGEALKKGAPSKGGARRRNIMFLTYREIVKENPELARGRFAS